MTRAEYRNGGALLTAPRGNQLPHARLTPELVKAIRSNADNLTAQQWAQLLNVHIRTIDGVRAFRTWRHVR